MNSPEAPLVITAGGVNSNKKGKHKKGKQQKSSKQEKRQKLITSDEESGNNTDSTPTTDNRLDTPNNKSTPSSVFVDNAKVNRTVDNIVNARNEPLDRRRLLQIQKASVKLDDLYNAPPIIKTNLNELSQTLEEQSNSKSTKQEYFWLAVCFFGIMGSFVAYGLLLEYATSGGKHLHELSFLFITSLLYTMTASVGRYVRAEKPSTIPPAQFAVLGLTSMGSTFFSVRALRYVIYPIQVLAKSCKPVPVMLFGALMGKKYSAKKYVKVVIIVGGVGLFMGGG